MQWKDVREGYVIRFMRGEDIVGGLLDFARTHAIEGAWVQALGAIADPELGYYHLDRRAYTRQVFVGEWEIAAIVGNLSRHEGEPVLHVHATIGGVDFSTRGGHLFAGKAGATCEVFVRLLGVPLERKLDPEIGLNLWSLGS